LLKEEKILYQVYQYHLHRWEILDDQGYLPGYYQRPSFHHYFLLCVHCCVSIGKIYVAALSIVDSLKLQMEMLWMKMEMML
jgi:hypothetical protein